MSAPIFEFVEFLIFIFLKNYVVTNVIVGIFGCHKGFSIDCEPWNQSYGIVPNFLADGTPNLIVGVGASILDFVVFNFHFFLKLNCDKRFCRDLWVSQTIFQRLSTLESILQALCQTCWLMGYFTHCWRMRADF